MMHKCLLDYAAMGTLCIKKGLYCGDRFIAQRLMTLMPIYLDVSMDFIQITQRSPAYP
jgi:hypothetical protein